MSRLYIQIKEKKDNYFIVEWRDKRTKALEATHTFGTLDGAEGYIKNFHTNQYNEYKRKKNGTD